MVIGGTQILAGQEAVDAAAERLQRGESVAVPTETVYGLAADATRQAAVLEIFRVKGRPANNPLITHVLSASDAADLTDRWPPAAEILASAFWPGPLTLILPSAGRLSPAVSAGLPTVGIRVPAHPVMRGILEKCALPLAAPSANQSGHVSPTTAEHVRADLHGRIGLIVDGGPCAVGIESTVVGFEGAQPIIYRPGIITAEDLDAALQLAGVAVRTRHTAPVHPDDLLPSPGLLKRHYAPNRPTQLFTRSAMEQLRARIESSEDAGGQSGVISFGPLPVRLQGAVCVELPADLYHAAGRLYDAMRQLDRDDIAAIWIELPGAESAGCCGRGPMSVDISHLTGMARVLADRLIRASTPVPEEH